MTQLSKYFALSELTVSETAARRGMKNTPFGKQLENLKQTAARMDEWGQPGTDEVPEDVLAQGAHQMAVMDADEVDVTLTPYDAPASQQTLGAAFDAERVFDVGGITVTEPEAVL